MASLDLTKPNILRMLTLLFVISVTTTTVNVEAAQRETGKQKDINNVNPSSNSNSMHGNVNNDSNIAIGSTNLNGISGSSGSNSNSNIHSSSNNNNNGNSGDGKTSNNNAGNSNSGITQNSMQNINGNGSSSSSSNSPSSSSSSSSSISNSGNNSNNLNNLSNNKDNNNSGGGSNNNNNNNNNNGNNNSGNSNNAITTPSSKNTYVEVEETRNGPYFDKAASKNVTALLGKTAYLNCRVKNLGNKTMLLQVSWVRHRDIHLLTVGRYTYTSDQRFRAIHQPQTEDWILQIKYPQHRDSGIYECQVSTTPHMSHYIHLNVVEPSTEIIGAPDLYIESGSTINLTCVIMNSPEPPAYIFWNHNDAIINYDSPRGGVSVVTIKGETTTSFLLIKNARPSDSGQYQCNPSNAKSKSVTVHVLNGEFPAAMQRAGQAHHRMSPNHYLLVYLSILLSTLVFIKYHQHYFPSNQIVS
ncbi:DEP domain-containing protein DDB_G0279099-like [Condylostylus longicornis]|uniref:DEP domain-containing protein DDB_G0279099-like n=1 Tax=Condylostylus longicornis TaxID=2530218 RepID=UPI00244E04EE|nr:DEP domain-containing protein DDB_G0279099-like [Condylostylus longicornis]